MSWFGRLVLNPNWRDWLIQWRIARGGLEELAAEEVSRAASEWRQGQGQAGTEQRAKRLAIRSSGFEEREGGQTRDKLAQLKEILGACVKALALLSIIPVFLGICYIILIWA